MVSAGVAALNCRAKLLVTPPALAVNVTALADATGVTLAVKPVLVAFAVTVTVVGIVTAALLVARLTLRPPLPAAELNVTVQASVPEPVMDALPQDSALKGALAAAIVPFRLATDLSPEGALPWMVSFPVAVPAAAISNCTPELTSRPAAFT
jgi:hypothetical protein